MTLRIYVLSAFVLLACLAISYLYVGDIKLLLEGRPGENWRYLSLSIGGLFSLLVLLGMGVSWYFFKLRKQLDVLQLEKGGEATERQGNVLSNSILERVGFGVCIIDTEGLILQTNQSFCDLLEYSHKELEGRKLSEFLGNEPVEQPVAPSAGIPPNVFNSHPSRRQKLRTKTNKGLEVMTSLTPLEEGNTGQLICAITEITRVDSEKRSSEAIVGNGQIGTWHINFEAETGEISQRGAEMLGYERGDIKLNLKFFETHIHPQDWPVFSKTLEKLVCGEADSFELELRFRCSSGSFKWMFTSGKVTERDPGGKPLLLTGAQIDIDQQKRTATVLKSENERLHRAQMVGKMGDWELNLMTEEINWSPMIFSIFDLQPGKEGSNLDLHNFSPSFSTAMKEQIQKAVEAQSPFEMVHEVHHLDKEKHLLIKGMPLFDSRGNLVKFHGIVQDVTDSTRTRLGVEEANRHLAFLSDNFPGVILQFKVKNKNSLEILLISKPAEQLWELSEAEVKLHPERILAQISKRDLVRLRQTMKESQENLTKFLYVFRYKNHWQKAIGLPSPQDNGEIVWNAFIYDVTDNVKAKKTMVEQENFLQILTQNASDAIVACDSDEKVVFFNKTFKQWLGLSNEFGFTEEMEKNDRFYSIDEQHPLKKEEWGLSRALREGKVKNFEFIIRVPGQPHRYVEANGEALFNEYSEKIGAVIVVRDITERINRDILISNTIIEARDEERSNLASELHDGILQSLAMVGSNLKNIGLDHQEVAKNESYKKALEYLENIIAQSRNMAFKIMPKAVMDLGLVGALEEVFAELVQDLKMDVHLNFNIEKRFSPKSELNTFRIILEGVKNAITHSKGDRVEVSIDFQENHVEVSIEDNGIGFDPETKNSKGIGLLTMRYRMRKLNGSMNITSGPTGTIIRLLVPF